jgi:hypothetical protein
MSYCRLQRSHEVPESACDAGEAGRAQGPRVRAISVLQRLSACSIGTHLVRLQCTLLTAQELQCMLVTAQEARQLCRLPLQVAGMQHGNQSSFPRCTCQLITGACLRLTVLCSMCDGPAQADSRLPHTCGCILVGLRLRHPSESLLMRMQGTSCGATLRMCRCCWSRGYQS